MVSLRIAVLQINPRLGAVSANIERANRLLNQFTKPIDLLVLPEFALTGYNFANQKELEPYLEPTTSGVSTQWASSISQKFNCHTLVGYPERDTSTNTIYNSAVLTNGVGSVIHNFRKAFLYMIDEQFGAKEGTGFECIKLPDLHNLKMQVGICMDINPYKFTAPFNAYEFAQSAKDNQSDLVVVPMCWTHSESPSLFPEDQREGKKNELEYEMDPDDTCLNSVNYWLQRSMPLFDADKRVCYVAANRCGWEDYVLYAGSSTIFTFKGEKEGELRDRVEYYGSLAQLEEKILYREVEL